MNNTFPLVSEKTIFKYKSFFLYSLLPHRASSVASRRHIQTIPVRLRHTQDDKCKVALGLPITLTLSFEDPILFITRKCFGIFSHIEINTFS